MEDYRLKRHRAERYNGASQRKQGMLWKKTIEEKMEALRTDAPNFNERLVDIGKTQRESIGLSSIGNHWVMHLDQMGVREKSCMEVWNLTTSGKGR